MADLYTSVLTTLTWRKLRGHLSYSYSTTAGQLTLTMTGSCQMQNAYQYGCKVRIAVDYPDGTTVNLKEATGALTSDPGSSWVDFASTGAMTTAFDRKAAPYTVYLYCEVLGATSGGYGPFPGDTGWQRLATVTVPAIELPVAPTGLTATVNSATQVTLGWTWDAQGTYASTFDVYRSTDGGAYVMVGQGLANNVRSWADKTTTANHSYSYQVKAWNARGWSEPATASAKTATAPPAPTSVTNTRESDNRNTIAWKDNPSALGVYGNINLQRQVDGGTWSDVTTLNGAATSYVDTTTQPNHSYAYRVRATNIAGASAWATSSATYNTPAAPGTPTAARTSATGVTVTFDNPALSETGIEWQRSTDGTTWGASTAVTGTDITSFNDSPGGGTFYYRVRNVRGALVSAWSATSNAVITIAPPAAPTLVAPGAIVKKSDATVVFEWLHNPIDGSAQTSAELRYSTDGTTWTTKAISGDAQTYTLANSFAVNASVTWQARTKGAHADFSPWSTAGAFSVLQVPQVAITSPASPLTDVPITVAWVYSDQSGYQVSARVSVLQAGKAVYSRDVKGSAISTQITSDEFLPVNKTTYSIQVLVTSSSSLTGVGTAEIAVNYTAPAVPNAAYSIDEDTSTLSLYVTAGVDSSAPATVSLGVFRAVEDGLLCLADKVVSGAEVKDSCPPIGTDLGYVIAAYTANGLSSVYAMPPVVIPSYGYHAITFGDDVLKLRLNVSAGESGTDDAEFVHYYGREKPVLYSGERRDGAINLMGATRDPAQANRAAALMRWGKRAIYRSPQGRIEAVHCNVFTNRSVPDWEKLDVTIDMQVVE
jgi:hypothetical protein